MTDHAADAIRAAAGRAIDPRLDLADVIRAHCPGRHAYVQHRDGRSPWCEACGYTERGALIPREDRP